MINKYSLIAINAKFIHSNLAIRYIKNYCKTKKLHVNILEFNINESFDKILSDIFFTKSNVFAFSCYIWNIELIFKICNSLKLILPNCIIILGGPEVSYENSGQLKLYQHCIDYIVSGEGEITFYELIDYLENHNKDIESIDGLTHFSNNKVIINKCREPISNLNSIPFPYEDIQNLQNKIIYYETSRGCPFKCQYCLSSLEKGVRFFSLERVFKDIDYFIDNNIKQIKLVDRTFNCNKKRSLSIMEYIISKKGNTNFHFEISPILIDEDFLSITKKAPKDLFQFEIGVQSTNPITLETIKRKEPFKDIKDNIAKLISQGLFHIHLDLIAGLPYEDMNSFKKSFNDTYLLKPDMLQLGFLKLLKGTGLRLNANDYGIKYHNHTPYEVISTDSMNYNDILTLKNIEYLLDTYYNSGNFNKSLTYIIKSYFENPFEFYLSFSNYYTKNNLNKRAFKKIDLYKILYNYISETFGMILFLKELIKYDYFLSFGTPVPAFLKTFKEANIKEKVNSFLKNDKNINAYMPELKSMNIRQKLKHVSFEVFYLDVIEDLCEKEIVLFRIKNTDNNSKTRILSVPLKTVK